MLLTDKAEINKKGMVWIVNDGFVKACRCLAIIILILGIIGSVVLASDMGLSYGTDGYFLLEERNWGLTLGIFFGGTVGSAFVSCILWFFSRVLEKDDKKSE